MESNLGYLLILVITELPTLAVLVAGAVLTLNARDRLPERVRHLLLAGIAGLLLFSLLTTGWSAGPRVGFGPLSFLLGMFRTLLLPIGLGLLIAAAFAGRSGRTGPGTPAPAAPPPAHQPPDLPR